jgi:hypothetical protein
MGLEGEVEGMGGRGERGERRSGRLPRGWAGWAQETRGRASGSVTVSLCALSMLSDQCFTGNKYSTRHQLHQVLTLAS